jgi:hypothetical protein
VKGENQWLVGAWAADGVERSVSISVPDLGEYQVPARPEGTVYLVAQRGDQLKSWWLDEVGMTPSISVSRLPLHQ